MKLDALLTAFTIAASLAPSLARAETDACGFTAALEALDSTPDDVAQIEQLRTMACHSGDAGGSVFYPNGAYAYVGPGFADTGSWKYPNGQYAYVSGNYADNGSWKFPNGNYAVVSGNYADNGSWKYANGKYAFVSGNYADNGSFKYPNGNYAFVSGNYADNGSWKYPDGKYAFVSGNYSDAKTWYYPNGNVYQTNSSADADGDSLTAVVGLYKGSRFRPTHGFHRLPRTAQVLVRLLWVQDQLQ